MTSQADGSPIRMQVKTCQCYVPHVVKANVFFYNEDDTALKECCCQTIRLWLEEFQDVYNQYCNGIVNSSASCKSRTSSGFAIQQNVLFRRICLGILIGYSNYVSEEGCELLLHYAATGTILDSPNTQNPGLKHRNRNSNWQEDSITSNKNYSRNEAMVGACLVFDFVDVTESMSSTLFESEECAVDFICRVKLRAQKYLVKCVKWLI